MMSIMNLNKKFHNFTDIDDSDLESIFDLGLKFIPQLSNNDTYTKDVLLCWFNFSNRLKMETGCPHGLNRYLTQTKNLLSTELINLSNLTRNLRRPWVEKLKSLNNKGLICVPTDKNLGVALIHQEKFNSLELEWLSSADLIHINSPALDVLLRLKKCIFRFLDNHEYWLAGHTAISKLKYLISQKTKLPLFKGILKIHKPKLQIRPVVRENCGPIYVLSKVICPLLKELLDKATRFFHSPHILSNSIELVRELERLKIPLTSTPWVLFSADVKSMYPNFSKDRLLIEVAELLSELNYPKEKQEFILKSLRLIFYNNYFTHNGLVFKSKSGIATGDPTSVMLANISKFLRENMLIKTNPDTILLYRRYVDDIFAIVNMDYYSDFLHKLDIVWEGFELTNESSVDELDFLDLRIYVPETTRESNKYFFNLQTKIFQKPQSLYQYLHWNSAHPKDIYKGIYIGEICRYIRNCSNRKDFLEIRKEFQKRLMKRGWPKGFITKIDRGSPNFDDRNALLNKTKEIQFDRNRVTMSLPFNMKGLSLAQAKNILHRFSELLPPDLKLKSLDARYNYGNSMEKTFTH